MLAPRIQRLAWRLHQYKYKIKYIEGKMNIADPFSRLPLNEVDKTTSSNVADEFIVESDMRSDCALLLQR